MTAPVRRYGRGGHTRARNKSHGRRTQAVVARTLARYDVAWAERPPGRRPSPPATPVPSTTAGRDSGDDAGRAWVAQLSTAAGRIRHNAPTFSPANAPDRNARYTVR
jgi:hypothetical protein